MFELKEYQSRALDAFTQWLNALDTARRESEEDIEYLVSRGRSISDDVRNYPKTAWTRLAESSGVAESAREYIIRTDDAGRPIPHICFKVPTGGGKTLLAAAALERLHRQTGLVLWITPTRAIYQQTISALRNREHPYRKMLERASGGRAKILEKEDPFTAGDIANYMCVMLLMLPSANRQKGREFLRMFRDSGRYPTLFPYNDDALADGRLLERYPDLERVSDNGPVKHSLFNVFKMLRPVIVLDEAHKAYGKQTRNAQQFARSINRLDPEMVIELSATPNRRISNLLVDISGADLKNEEMIKLPVQVTSFTGDEWRHTLEQASNELDKLDEQARSLYASENRYIRPIAVVRVERTGKDQRTVGRIHAEDVREHLIQNLSVPAETIRVKSSDNDELGQEDLLSEYSQVRWIITKSALMEGWDCPFAYLLVMLDNTRAQNAITQLVGRVMRQPYARRTGNQALDQCYVYCSNTDVSLAVQRVKNGLEQEGLTGLGDDVLNMQADDMRLETVQRRLEFRGEDIFLPKVLHKDGDEWVDLDYHRHILPGIDWSAIQAPDPQATLPDRVKRQTASVDVGDAQPVFHDPLDLYIDKTLKVSWFARRLSDVIPNPWQAARIVKDLLHRLREAGESEDDTYDRRGQLATQLREHTEIEVEKQAEKVFRAKLANGEIRFDLQTGEPNYRMVDSYEIPVAETDGTLQRYGRSLQLNLFDPIYDKQFDSDLERKFAFYLDEQKAIQWWHRIAVRQQHEYYLRGWQRERIYPDFTAWAEAQNKYQLLVFETKGGHMAGNADTEYKRKLFDVLEDEFDTGKMTVYGGPVQGTFKIVFRESQFAAALANLNGAHTI